MNNEPKPLIYLGYKVTPGKASCVAMFLVPENASLTEAVLYEIPMSLN